jgi:cytochrome c6
LLDCKHNVGTSSEYFKIREENMKKSIQLTITAAALLAFATAGIAKEESTAKSGEALFKTHCAVCHPDGGNIINPEFTLHKKDRERHEVKTAADIVKKVRNPGPGMTKFDKATIPDKDAKKIAEYILKTFN